MREVNSFAALAAALARDVEKMAGEKHQALHAGATLLLKHVKEKPGTYQPGWPALQPETIARKKTGDSPELESGAMLASYDEHVGASDFDVGSNSDIALYQEMGTSRIPPRPVLGAAFHKDMPDVMAKVVETYVAPLLGGVKPAGDTRTRIVSGRGSGD